MKRLISDSWWQHRRAEFLTSFRRGLRVGMKVSIVDPNRPPANEVFTGTITNIRTYTYGVAEIQTGGCEWYPVSDVYPVDFLA